GAQYYSGANVGQPTGCSDRTLYQRLTQLDSWMCAMPTKKYITPNSLANSQIYQAVAGDPTGNGTCFKAPGVPMERMPLSPASMLSTADQQKLASWINAGAPNN